jgi:general secretion pathway protein G
MIVRQRSLSARRRSGFTLLEILVVVTIILVLATAATVSLMTVLRENKDDAAKINAVNLEKSVKAYIIKNQDAPQPQSLQECIKYIEGAQTDPNKLLDPWGNPYQIGYNESGSPYVFTTNPDTGAVIRSDTSSKTK